MTYYELAQQIDRVEREVTRWESTFLETALKAGPHGRLSERQQYKLRELGEAYLGSQTMGAFSGQA
jgi:hypothetical protein